MSYLHFCSFFLPQCQIKCFSKTLPLFFIDRGTLKDIYLHDKHLGENARRDNGGNLSCLDSGGRSEPQVNLIYSKELYGALSGPSAAAFLSSNKSLLNYEAATECNV